MPLRSIFQVWHHPQFLPKHLARFSFSVFLRQISESLVLIVEPAFLYQIGPKISFLQQWFHTPFSQGMAAIIIYFILSRVTLIALQKPLVYLQKILGISTLLFLGQLLALIITLLFLRMEQQPNLIWIAALVRGLSIFFYWNSYHIFLMTELPTNGVGHSVGSFRFLTGLATLISPLLGALSATSFGFAIPLLLSALLKVGSLSVIIGLPNIHIDIDWRWSDFFSWIRARHTRFVGFSLGGFIWGETGMLILWPLFLLSQFQRLNSVAYILSSASLLAWFLAYFAGVSFDHRRLRRPIQLGAGTFLGVLWLPRWIFASFPFLLVATEALDKILFSVYDTLFYSTQILWAKHVGIARFALYRQMVFNFAEVIGFSLLFLLLCLGWSWSVVFAALSFATLTTLSLRAPGEKLP